MTKMDWERATDRDKMREARKYQPRKMVRRERNVRERLLAIDICDAIQNGVVSDADTEILLIAADRLSKGLKMTPQQAGKWGKYAKKR